MVCALIETAPEPAFHHHKTPFVSGLLTSACASETDRTPHTHTHYLRLQCSERVLSAVFFLLV